MLRALTGALGGVVAVALTVAGVGYVGASLVLLVLGGTALGALVVSLLLGLALLYLGLQVGAATAVADVVLARRDGDEAGLRRQLRELRTSRAEVVEAVDDERRRVERDLHDGVQQELVALAVLLGRARRTTDPAQAAQLLGDGHALSQDLIRALRRVSWSVYPSTLDDRGLADALETVADHSPVPATVDYAVDAELPPSVQTAAFFLVAESLTNAAKHAGASRVDVRVRADGDALEVTVADDGRGGADAEGGGLRGLRRRLAAIDGRLEVDSPAGGPTVVRGWLPCGS